MHQARSELSMLHADVQSLQQPDGSFAGDAWGEIDTRCIIAYKAAVNRNADVKSLPARPSIQLCSCCATLQEPSCIALQSLLQR